MVAKGLVKESKDKSDGRRNVVMLSAKGKKMSDSFAEQCVDVTTAIEEITRQTRNDLWKAIEEWEELLSDKSLLQRVKEAKMVSSRPSELLMKNGYLPISEWKKPTIRPWIIRRNTFWIKAELFWWLFIRMSRSVYVLCARWIIRFMIMSWPNLLSVL